MSLLTILLFIAAEPTAVTKPAAATPTCVTAVTADGAAKGPSSTCTRVVTGCAILLGKSVPALVQLSAPIHR
jgi:hypothetical protein